ncbi:MAG: hypothetical protein J0I84_20710 [Terrimonas sp.]|nr:hypothetical protein [Terrimonas sp.]OJY95538.1 MAG: hypothetical protein BGP13_11870 [Sphingobacteriales bacterium 40-81]
MKKIFIITCIICTSTVVCAQKETKPPPPPPPPPAIEATKFSGVKSFLDHNPGVAKVHWKDPDTIVLKMKDKTTRSYNLSDAAIKKAFSDQYGDIPVPPPPPPPPPAKEN